MIPTRLYRLFQPSHYTLQIAIDRPKRRFQGVVTIRGKTTTHATSIPLHAHRLHVVRATVDGRPAAYEHQDNDVLNLTSGSLQPGEHEVAVEFEGNITDPMHGLYPCHFTLSGKTHELLATQFESHHAREVFPCIDEPEAKATFKLTLDTEKNITVLSNTPIAQQSEHGDRLTTRFETTPRMSTYLLAWVIGDLAYQEATTRSGITVRAYATPDKQSQLTYAAQTGARYLDFFTTYFGVPYPLPKCDLIALPDFSSGAMENWGCITFRETYLLADDHTSAYIRQWIDLVIAHELSHQWFGNLVTMRWWNDLWLNESFANWMEYLAVAELHPEWDMWTQYYQNETAYAIERDAMASVQKIQQDVRTPHEIGALFDPAIVYAKGGSLLNMLHAHIGADAFRNGIRAYLQQHQYSNTSADDLWDTLGNASRRDVSAFMQPWITQPGLPVVTIGMGERTVNLHQRRFFANPSHATGNQQAVWPIPLFAGDSIAEEVLTQPSASYARNPESELYVGNKGRTGYYLTLYDEIQQDRLAAELRSGRLSAIDRLGLLTDSLNLSKAGLQSQVASLRLLDLYKDESCQPVWGAISSHIDALKMFADDSEELQAHLRTLVRSLAVSQYQRLGWTPATNEPHFDTLLRPIIIAHMVYAEDEEVLAKLIRMVGQAQSPQDVQSDLRSTACAAAAAYGNEADFQKLIEWHADTASAEQRTHLITGLCAARSPALIAQILALLTTDAVRLQDLFYWLNNLTRNRYARDQTWRWLQENWQWITDRFGNDLHYSSFVKYAANACSTPEQLAAYRTFFATLLEDPGMGRTITLGIESIEARIAWRQRDGQAVARYLQSL